MWILILNSISFIYVCLYTKVWKLHTMTFCYLTAKLKDDHDLETENRSKWKLVVYMTADNVGHIVCIPKVPLFKITYQGLDCSTKNVRDLMGFEKYWRQILCLYPLDFLLFVKSLHYQGQESLSPLICKSAQGCFGKHWLFLNIRISKIP